MCVHGIRSIVFVYFYCFRRKWRERQNLTEWIYIESGGKKIEYPSIWQVSRARVYWVRFTCIELAAKRRSNMLSANKNHISWHFKLSPTAMNDIRPNEWDSEKCHGSILPASTIRFETDSDSTFIFIRFPILAILLSRSIGDKFQLFVFVSVSGRPIPSPK